MSKILEIFLIIIAVSCVAVADVLLKKVAFNVSGFVESLKNPLMLGVVVLYLSQIVIFLYVFVRKAELGVVGIVQTALYAVIVIGSGIIFFGEDFSPRQIVGVALALGGVALINS